MKEPWMVISGLESDNSRLAKEAIIKTEAENKNDIFFSGCKLALDATITFGIKQIREKSDQDGPGIEWNDFYVEVSDLIDRTTTGNAAKDLVDNLIERSTKVQWNNWYRRILLKDLKCGVSEKTINNVVKKQHPHYKVPVFTVQLAHDSANHQAKLKGKKIINSKLDGIRLITIVYPNGKVDQFSRNGKEIFNFETVKNQFAGIAAFLPEPMVFDGEIMSSSFQDLMKQVYRKENVETTDAILYLFDMLPLSDFELGICNIPQSQRSKNLEDLFQHGLFLSLLNVRLVGDELVDLDTNEGQLRFKELNKQAIDDGLEGVMLKDPDAPYELKRSVAWLKLKPFIDVSLEIIGYEEGTGRNEGRLGALVCSGEEDGKIVVSNVGSGFDDSDRLNFWKSRDELIGQIVEVRADAITKSQDSDTYSLRFPRFLRFRGFQPGEKM